MRKRLRITIVMTTYNGVRFVEEQLLSIINQSRCPDELIIMDDGSTDDTVKIIKKILQSCTLNCQLIVNEKNIGWRKNFINGFHHATGDVIFCADQDDIWCSDKLEEMTTILEENDKVNVLASNLIPRYEQGALKIADFYINIYGKEYLAKVNLLNEGLTVIRPGCTVCFRKKLLNYIDLVWMEKLAHDEVVWALGIVTDSLYIVNKPLIQFRRHGSNNSPTNEKTIKRRLELAEINCLKLSNLINNASVIGINHTNLAFLNTLKEFQVERINAFNKRSIILGIKLLKNKRLYGSIKLWFGDIFSLLNG